MDAAIAFIRRIRERVRVRAGRLWCRSVVLRLPEDAAGDNIKIDGSFVRDLLVDSFDQAMIEAMQRIGSVMGIATIAEFVKSEAVMERLREAGVGYARGGGVNRPELFLDGRR